MQGFGGLRAAQADLRQPPGQFGRRADMGGEGRHPVGQGRRVGVTGQRAPAGTRGRSAQPQILAQCRAQCLLMPRRHPQRIQQPLPGATVAGDQAFQRGEFGGEGGDDPLGLGPRGARRHLGGLSLGPGRLGLLQRLLGRFQQVLRRIARLGCGVARGLGPGQRILDRRHLLGCLLRTRACPRAFGAGIGGGAAQRLVARGQTGDILGRLGQMRLGIGQNLARLARGFGGLGQAFVMPLGGAGELFVFPDEALDGLIRVRGQ